MPELKVCEMIQVDAERSMAVAREMRPDNILVGAGQFEASLVNRKAWTTGMTITVSFENGSAKDQEFIKSEAEKWLAYANLKFDWVSSGGMIRVRRENGGSNSYVGTDALLQKSGPTLRIGWIDNSVVKHEFGHALGLNHSHNALNFPYHWNEAAVIKDLSEPPNNWNIGTIRWNVLDKTTEGVTETKWSINQVMNYDAPASWTVEGVEIHPGTEIGSEEAELMRIIYPNKEIVTKVIHSGMKVTGRGNQEFQFNALRGTYTCRPNPRNTKVLCNGKSMTLIGLKEGVYRVNVQGSSSWDFVIKKL